jgi:hypothetical protein
MITTNWISNFCNNMFQYATLYAVSKKTGFQLTTDGWHGESTERTPVGNGKELFNLPIEPDFSLYHETTIFNDTIDQKYNSNIFKIIDGTRLNGFFQTDKYFIDYRKDILDFFTFKNLMYDIRAKEIIQSLNRKVIICAHSREGDYVTDPGFTTVNEEYFKTAFNILMIKHNLQPLDIGCIFISDNKKSSKLNFLNNTNIKLLISQENNFVDMSIMKNANHCITANSTFSWWGAWLNKNNPTIISPYKWINFGFENKNYWLPSDIKMSIPNQYFVDSKGYHIS